MCSNGIDRRLAAASPCATGYTARTARRRALTPALSLKRERERGRGKVTSPEPD
jgi:hypothetical protein